MGLFSSKKVTTVSARTMQLVDIPPNPFAEAVLGAVVREEGITSSLLNVIHGSTAASIPHIFNEARDNYTLGLPQGKALNYSNVDLDRIDEILLLSLGSSPLLKAVGAAYMNVTPTITAYPHLYNVRQYNRWTNLVTVPPSGITWVQSTEPGSLNMATANKQVRLQSVVVAGDGVSLDITYGLFVERPVIIWDEYMYSGTTNLQYVQEPYTYIENIPLTNASTINWGEDYLVVFYNELLGDGVTPIRNDKSWVYRVASNIYPDIKPVDVAAETLDYFPVIPLRYYNQDLMGDAYKTTDLYVTSKKLARLAKIDLDTLATKLNENPSIAEIDHAYVMYGINIRTEVKASLLYMHKFFAQLYSIQYTNRIDYQANVSRPLFGLFAQNSLYTGVSTVGTFEEHGLSTFLDYDYVTSTVGFGKIGTNKVGNITKEFIEYTEYISTGLYDSIQTNVKGAMLLRLQVAKDVVHTIGVYGLEHRNLIYNGIAEHTSMLDVMRDPDENNLVIPIQYQLTQALTLKLRMNVYADAMLLVINTYQVTKLKWYQSSWFRIIMIVVAVVLIVICLIVPGLQWLAAVIADGLTMALAIQAVTAILISIAVSVAATYLVKEFGAKWGIIATIALMVVAAIATGGKSIAASIQQFTMLTPQYCIVMASALIDATNDLLMEAGQEIVNEYVDFQAKLEDRYKELKTAQDLLNNSNDVDPLVFVRPARLKIVPNESPDQFYSRCLELPAYTMFTIHEQIPNYCSTLLKLPRMPNINMYVST